MKQAPIKMIDHSRENIAAHLDGSAIHPGTLPATASRA
ncbi:hypothetical protein J2T55_002342 [Methylohalomonas lacus]|uniref:Uncharacterized protein n=1 Tax=Methylohalomonas lacus TaxID=398773 RepID=A0AAE3HN63_9GAMM|nr:hypothetical protein [Methylohalomonas lacus]